MRSFLYAVSRGLATTLALLISLFFQISKPVVIIPFNPPGIILAPSSSMSPDWSATGSCATRERRGCVLQSQQRTAHYRLISLSDLLPCYFSLLAAIPTARSLTYHLAGSGTSPLSSLVKTPCSISDGGESISSEAHSGSLVVPFSHTARAPSSPRARSHPPHMPRASLALSA